MGATWGVLHAAMLAGLLGAAAPVVVHLWSRGREEVIDWGAMAFLDPGRQARRRLVLTERLLMLARMALFAVVALALARPYGGGSGSAAGSDSSGGGPARDVVLVLDGSAGMGRRLAGGASPRGLAVAAARRVVGALRPGDTAAVLVAADRVRSVIEPPAIDLARVDAALSGLADRPGRGSSDLPAALAEAFRVLERTENPARDVVVLTDGRRDAWRPGDASRWALVRDLHRRLPAPPRVWAVTVATGEAGRADAPDGSVGPLRLSRALAAPGLPITVSAEVANAGPGPLTRTAELLVDGRPAAEASRRVGPVPEGGRAAIAFTTAIDGPGSHLLTVRLTGGDDALTTNDESSAAVEVAAALPVLLVDGGPDGGPLGGATGFLRAALSPPGDDAPQARATVVPLKRFTSAMLDGQRVLVLANVDRIGPEPSRAVARFLDAGSGVLIAPGGRTDLADWNGVGWMPAKLLARKGDPSTPEAVAHPAPSSFSGPVLAPFARGDAPPLGRAALFTYTRLAPTAGATVAARLDTGDPWVVEGPKGRGRVLVLAGPLDAGGGTLVANPDFVPLAHEWVRHLAGGAGPRPAKPGEPIDFDLPSPPPTGVATLPVLTPGGDSARAAVIRSAGSARARFEDTVEPGVYRLALPEPPGGFAYATVDPDPRAPLPDPDPLAPSDLSTLTQDWPLAFETDPARLSGRLLADPRPARREFWQALILAALGGLCVEIYLTRRLVRGQVSAPASRAIP
jgi:hypothetical protein